MKTAIIGGTGLIGLNLYDIYKADVFCSSNINEIESGYDLLFIAAPSAKKWVAAANPDADNDACLKVADAAINTKSKKIVYFSTIDVYSPDQACLLSVDEDTIPLSNEAYGKNRRKLELKLLSSGLDCSIIRLPGLFGKYLSKNPIFDIKTLNQVDKIKLNATYQWFNLRQLPVLLNKVIYENISLINVVNPPIGMREILANYPALLSKVDSVSFGANYNLGSKFGYVKNDKEATLAEILAFINEK